MLKWLRKPAHIPEQTKVDIEETVIQCLHHVLEEYGVEILFMRTDLSGGVVYRTAVPRGTVRYKAAAPTGREEE